MRPRLLTIGIGCILILAGLAFAVRPLREHWLLLRAHWLLRSAENESNRLYAKYRPFLYRWADAPYGVSKGIDPHNCSAIPIREINHLLLQTTEAEEILGSRSWRLRGRAGLLSCQLELSIDEYKGALRANPHDAGLQLELGMAFALNADAKNPLAYENALELVLKASRQWTSAESLYDSALLFEQTQLYMDAREKWKETADKESVAEWKKDSDRRSAARRDFVSAHDRQIDALSSPLTWSADAAQPQEGEELALDAATREWLGQIGQSPDAEKAAQQLGVLLLTDREHHDKWLVDLLKTASLPAVQGALAKLTEAVRRNLKGEYSHAGVAARLAQKNFAASGNRAGVLRAQLEIVYSLDRREDAKACLVALADLETEADQRNYTWITAQAKLENLSCQARPRTHDIIDSRKATLDWVRNTGYRGLELRASGFMTEPGVAANSRSTIWLRALEGMRIFWSTPLPVIRVYAFYYTLAHSVHNAGNLEAALAVLREGTLLMPCRGLNLLRGSLLYPLGQWQMEAGFQEQAKSSFAEMEEQFNQVDAAEIAAVRVEGDVAYAEALVATGRAQAGLDLLLRRTQRLTWPYSHLKPNLRRLLLPALGNAYFHTGGLQNACKNFLQSITEVRSQMTGMQNHAQRDDTLREIEPSWRALAAVKLSLNRPVEALTVWETFRSGRNPKKRAFAFPGCKSASSPPSFALPQHGTALVYAFLPTGLSAWLIQEGKVEQRQLDGSRINELAARLSALVSNPNSPLDDITTLSVKLYELLLGRFHLPRSGTLIIDPDGGLAVIPWSVLEEERHHPLVERFAIAQVIGILDLQTGGEKAGAGRDRALIFEPPVLSGDLTYKYPYPSYAREEAETINHLLPNSLLVPEAQADFQTLRANVPRKSLFHFAGHSVSNGGFPALLLPQSRGSAPAAQYVTAEQIAALDLRQMKTVVLASCSSGAGEQGGMVNLDSLVRAFLEAGAHRVIAAGWDVRSAPTEELMIAFYERLKDGKFPAEALRQAQIEVRQKTPHPYDWAGFQVFGQP
ncbi:MAG TPA: CHAT domain-containing protein [Candidatus Angelobacter sp.]|jgi:CHAT domain-containing protein|nr:CHAT domain-containing protein [Candidatus Angelobacter sp.]